jgi:hypothetical protein
MQTHTQKLSRAVERLFWTRRLERYDLCDLDAFAVLTAEDAGVVLDALAAAPVPRLPGRTLALYALLRALADAPGRPARGALAARGVPLLDRLAGRLDPAAPAWGLALHTLAAIGTPDSLACWASHFTRPRAGRPGAYDLACADLLANGPPVPGPVQAQLRRRRRSCLARRPYVAALLGQAPPPSPRRRARATKGDGAAACGYVVERREVPWPVTGERRRLYLLRWPQFEAPRPYRDTYHDVVGAQPLCLGLHSTGRGHRRQADAAFAAACFGELMRQGLIAMGCVARDEAYQALLRQRWPGESLEDVRAAVAAEPAARLGYGARIVVAGTARRGGHRGWLILDGERSAWHDTSTWSSTADTYDLLQVHVGRRLLRLAGRPGGEPSRQRKPG